MTDNRNTKRIVKKNKQILSRAIQVSGGKSYSCSIVDIEGKEGKIHPIWVVTSGDFSERYASETISDHKPINEAPFLLNLTGTPRPGSTLSSEAYQDHVLEGKPFPDPAECFKRVSNSIDHFVSFDGSFASQADLSDFLACWVIGTYATDAFDTVGYVWPNGERGCGKTQCLKTIMSLSFMGLTATSSSSFASVRDEAALGGTLGFDDCENLSKMDSNKRELLLAGNTKGTGFMLKEPGAKEGQWNTRYIDCFAPRAFTSIGLPDDTLASRTILIPLVRTTDTEKTRRKPTNQKDWLYSPDEIRDAIWLNVARDLIRIEEHKNQVNDSTEVAGRDFDIFQAPLTIAYWLEADYGYEGLFDRMLALMETYQETKHKNLLPSAEQVVFQALTNLLEGKAKREKTSTFDIVNEAQSVLRDWDITDITLTSMDSQKVGMLLKRLGFKKSASNGNARGWIIAQDDVDRVAKTYGITLEKAPVADQPSFWNDPDDNEDVTKAPW